MKIDYLIYAFLNTLESQLLQSEIYWQQLDSIFNQP